MSTTADAPFARGRFPVVVFSHGLTGAPADYRGLATRWAAAGFVVAAPAYPFTHRGASYLNLVDIVNQPADASQVITQLLALNAKAGSPLYGHLAADRLAAAGHSAGAITTIGLFTSRRDPRLRAGIVLAGNSIGVGDSFAGPPAAILFVHGRKDRVVPYDTGTAVFDADPWPKALLTLPSAGHDEPYIFAGARSFAVVAASTTDFLRATLYGDRAAAARLRSDATVTGLARIDDQLGKP